MPPDEPAAGAPAFQLNGSLDGIGPEGQLIGWVWAPSEPTVRRRIELLANGVVFADAVADLPRGDLAAAGIGDGGHAFAVPLPPTVRRPSSPTIVAVRDAASGLPVGSDMPMEETQHEIVVPVAVQSQSPTLVGSIDQVTNDGWVTGWCWYPREPERRLTVNVLVDGLSIASTRAAEFRPDLKQAGIGDGEHGFSYALPWEVVAEKGAVTVEVREADSDVPLGDPVTLRIGGMSATEDRIIDLERQVRVLRSELESYALQVQRRDEDRAARELFRTVADFFSELAESPSPGAFAGAGLRGTIAGFTDTYAPLALSIPPHPDATIVIGAGAQVSAVYRCVASLKAIGADERADIVVLDDGGHGGEAVLLPSVIRNLRYHRVAAGAPALAGHEAAVREARGRIVICLSPDVVPGPGSVDMLLATFADEPAAAIVGARIARTDGMLESAGCSLKPDFEPRLLGRAEPDDLPEFSFMRAVEAVDARAFAVRRDAVAVDGSSHEAYATASIAVLDMCLAARTGGRSVLYQPASAMTLARDAAPDRLPDEQDLRSLRLRWQSIVRGGDAFVGRALFIDTELPRPDRDAGSVLTCEIMQTMRALGWRVAFAPVTGAFDDYAAVALLERRGIELARPPRYASITAFLQEHGDAIGLVHVCRHSHAGLLIDRIRELAPAAKFVFAPVDLHFLRDEREAALTGRTPDPAARERELALVRDADVTVVHSDFERDILMQEAPAANVQVLRWIGQVADVVPPFVDRAGICFVGGFRHPPNVDGVLWFANAVLPLIRADLPDLEFHIVGADVPATIAGLAGAGVTVHGWVPDLQPLFDRICVSVAPLRYGAGFKGKVATSLALGVPVVGTAVAIEGTGLSDGDGVRVADDPAAFAQAVVILTRDRDAWTELSARGLARCAALYSPGGARLIYRELLGSLGLPFHAV